MHLIDLVRRQSDGTSIGGALGDPTQAPSNGNSHISSYDIICHAVGLPIVTVVVLLRLWAKKFVIGQIHLEDYVCIAAYKTIIVYAILALFAGKYSAGVHAAEVPPQNYVLFAKYIYVLEITYGVCAMLVKLAVCLLLARIFGASSKFNLAAHCLSALLVLYYAIITFIKIFSCTPISRLWYPMLPGMCLNNQLIIYLDAIMALVFDIIIILLPVPIVWRLNMKTSRKLTITATFAVGSLACVAAILRVYANTVLNRNADKFYYALPVVLWSFAELYIGIITACLPILPALLKHMLSSANSRKSSPAASLYFRLGRKRKPSAIKSTNFSNTLVETRRSGEGEIEMEEGTGGEELLYKELPRSSKEQPSKKALTSPGPAKSPPKSPRPGWVDFVESISRVPSRQEDPKFSVESPRSLRSPRADYEIPPMPPIAELSMSVPKPKSPAPTNNYRDLVAARERASSNDTQQKQAEAQKQRQGSHAPEIAKKREEWMGTGSTRGPRYKDVLDVRPRAPSTQSTREVSRLVEEAINAAPAMPGAEYEAEPPPPVRKDTRYQRKKRPADLKIPERG